MITIAGGILLAILVIMCLPVLLVILWYLLIAAFWICIAVAVVAFLMSVGTY